MDEQKFYFLTEKILYQLNLMFSHNYIWQNLLEKSAERETRQEYALAMIQCKVLKQLENLEQQKYDDEDITDDIKFLLERLGESVQDLRYFLKTIMNSLQLQFIFSCNLFHSIWNGLLCGVIYNYNWMLIRIENITLHIWWVTLWNWMLHWLLAWLISKY